MTEDITERYCDRCGWVPVRDLAEALTWNAIHAAHRGMPAAGQGR